MYAPAALDFRRSPPYLFLFRRVRRPTLNIYFEVAVYGPYMYLSHLLHDYFFDDDVLPHADTSRSAASPTRRAKPLLFKTMIFSAMMRGALLRAFDAAARATLLPAHTHFTSRVILMKADAIYFPSHQKVLLISTDFAREYDAARRFSLNATANRYEEISIGRAVASAYFRCDD